MDKPIQPPPIETYLPIGQGLFYMATGIWPLVSIDSFQRVTGPKVDLWLVKTVGVLVTVIGAALVVAGLRRQVAPETKVLAVGSAAGLVGIDTIYVARRRISPIYLADAIGEVGLVLLWLFVLSRGSPEQPFDSFSASET